MIVFLLTLVRVDRGQSKFVIPRERIIRNAFPFVIPCAAASRSDSPIGLLPMIYCINAFVFEWFAPCIQHYPL